MTKGNVLRVRRSALQLTENALHFDGELFTGLVYCFDKNGALDRLADVKNGLETGLSDDLLETPEDTGQRIDLDFEDEGYDDGYTYWNGLRFCGVGYIFTTSGFLTEEVAYNFGDRHNDSRRWSDSGSLTSTYNTKESWHWYENGDLWMHEVNGESGGFKYEIEINKSKEIESLAAKKGCDIDFYEWKKYGISNSLKLRGDGVHDNLLLEISANKSFKNLEELWLIDTVVSTKILLEPSLSEIKKIHLNNNKNITMETIEELREKLPLCDIQSS